MGGTFFASTTETGLTWPSVYASVLSLLPPGSGYSAPRQISVPVRSAGSVTVRRMPPSARFHATPISPRTVRIEPSAAGYGGQRGKQRSQNQTQGTTWMFS